MMRTTIEDSVAQLVAMGFERSAALNALRATNYDVNAAAAMPEELRHLLADGSHKHAHEHAHDDGHGAGDSGGVDGSHARNRGFC